MKKNRKFTTTELIIIIIVIMIVICFLIPIILSTIQSYKKNKVIKKIYNYIDTVNYNIKLSDQNIKTFNIENKEYDINDKNLSKIKVKKPDSGVITISKRKIVSGNFCIDGYRIEYDGQLVKALNTNECKNSKIKKQNIIVDKETCVLETDIIDGKTVYYIDSIEDMYAFSAATNGGETFKDSKVVLRVDLDFSEYTSNKKTRVCSVDDNKNGFEPIGNFLGDFDGGAHIISNLKINKPTEDFVAIFKTAYNSNIYGLYLKNIEVVGNNNVACLIGFIHDGIIKDIILDNITITSKGNTNLVTADFYEGKRSNILVKNTTINCDYIALLFKSDSTIIENGNINCNSGGIAINNYSENVKINNQKLNGFSKNKIGDLKYYDSLGLDTVIDGDNDESGYYFDYENNTSKNIILKSTK